MTYTQKAEIINHTNAAEHSMQMTQQHNSGQ
jgi:hypothetical protein